MNVVISILNISFVYHDYIVYSSKDFLYAEPLLRAGCFRG